MTDDTMKPLQDQINKIFEAEKLLNSTRLSDIDAEKRRRAEVSRRESSELARLKEKEKDQAGVIAREDAESQAMLQREGEVLHLTEELQRGFTDEVHRHEAAEKKLKEQATALASKLEGIKRSRP